MAKFKFDENPENKPNPETQEPAPDAFSKLSRKQGSESATDNLLNNIKPFSFDDFMKRSTTAPRQPAAPPPNPTTQARITPPPGPPPKPKAVENDAAEWINTDDPIPADNQNQIRSEAGELPPALPTGKNLLNQLASQVRLVDSKDSFHLRKLAAEKALRSTYAEYRLLHECARCGSRDFIYGRLAVDAGESFAEIQFVDGASKSPSRMMVQRCNDCGLVQMTTSVPKAPPPISEIDADLFEGSDLETDGDLFK